MATHTQSAHFNYTINEWKQNKHQNYLDIIFKDNDIKIIFDIGANVGGTSYIFNEYAKNNNKTIEQIFVFEPDNENMNFMKNKLDESIDKTIKTIFIEKGIYYGKTSSVVCGMGHKGQGLHHNVGGYSIQECCEKAVELRNSRGESIDSYVYPDKIFELDTLENLSNGIIPDFVKIDVEGAEVNIIENSTILKKAKYLIIEWNSDLNYIEFFIKHLPDHKIIRNDFDILLKRNY